MQVRQDSAWFSEPSACIREHFRLSMSMMEVYVLSLLSLPPYIRMLGVILPILAII